MERNTLIGDKSIAINNTYHVRIARPPCDGGHRQERRFVGIDEPPVTETIRSPIVTQTKRPSFFACFPNANRYHVVLCDVSMSSRACHCISNTRTREKRRRIFCRGLKPCVAPSCLRVRHDLTAVWMSSIDATTEGYIYAVLLPVEKPLLRSFQWMPRLKNRVAEQSLG